MNFKKIGIVLIVLGLMGLASGLVNYSTGGPQPDAKYQQVERAFSPKSGFLLIFVFPVVGVLAVFAGIALVVLRKKTIESI